MARKINSSKQYQQKEISWYNKKYSVEDIAKKAIETAKTVAAFINVEHHDSYNTVTTGATSTMIIEDLCAITAGTGPDQRVGNSVKLNFFEDKSIFQMVAGSHTILNVRVIYFKWKDTDAPTASDVLQSQSVLGFINKDSSQKMSVVSDKVHHFDDSHRKGSIVSFSKAFKSFHLEWKEDNTTAKVRFFRAILTDSAVAMGRDTREHYIYVDN